MFALNCLYLNRKLLICSIIWVGRSGINFLIDCINSSPIASISFRAELTSRSGYARILDMCRAYSANLSELLDMTPELTTLTFQSSIKDWRFSIDNIYVYDGTAYL